MLRIRSPMFEPWLIHHLRAGCSMIVGTTDRWGAPYATRAWSVQVLDPAAGVVRVSIASGELEALGDDLVGRPLAVSGADVATLECVQLKGRVRSVEAADVDETADAVHHASTFVERVIEIDGGHHATI